MCNFEKKVLESFKQNNISLNTNLRIGVAVSGGADSVSLLISLVNILSVYNIPLYVITINHNIRSEEETSGDALYVKNLCQNLKNKGFDVICTVSEIERGKVSDVAQNRKTGIEDSARYLRYQLFEQFISENKLDFLCLAHNKDDQLETVLMRFLQGSSIEALTGIKVLREKYFRPLLNLSRKEIENYLIENKIDWRTDSTNLETQYLRNKIRLNLVPLLNHDFPGWKNAVIKEMFRLENDADFINIAVESFNYECSQGKIVFSVEEFLNNHKSVQIRILKKLANLCGEDKRIPYPFLEDIIESISKNKEKEFIKEFDKIEVLIKKNTVFIKKAEKHHTESNFFDIIEETGSYDFPFGKLYVSEIENEDSMVNVFIETSDSLLKIGLPFIVRSARSGDEIAMSDKSSKHIFDVYSDWHIPEADRWKIPVFQEMNGTQQTVRCIMGSFLGYKDWIVK